VPFPFHNFERSHKPRRDFSTLSKLDRTLVRFHPQEDSITNFITTVNAMCISITLLSILRFFNPLSYRFHLFFHFLDRFWSYQDPILKSIPAQRRLTWSPVKKLEWCHLNGALIVVVVCKLYQWKELFPMLMLVHHIHTQHIFQDLVHSFYLPVCLKVICVLKLSWVPKASWKLVQNHPVNIDP
jgi:hypothetical protein